jgi:ABC-type uncharacterized transport system ATPase subunit
MTENAVDMVNITKKFGETVANDSVNLSVQRGEIHCILGENGAGKTTLMNVLFGLYGHDQGKISIKGREVDIGEPSEAIDLGIGMIHQNFMLVDRLTVTENIMAGAEPSRRGVLDEKKAKKEVEEIAARYGLQVDPTAKVENISVGDQQRVEILKALYRQAEILILDEPTAVLTPQEVEELFEIMRELRDDGKTLVFITHKLKETMAISDQITILRDGKNVGTVPTEETSPEELARMMVGREVVLRVDKNERAPGSSVLEVEDMNLHNPENNLTLQNISFEIEAGEILGVAGVEGNGQLELEEGIMGLRELNGGSIRLNNSNISEYTTRERRDEGIAHIPSDRLRRGLVTEFGLDWNMILGSEWSEQFSRNGFLKRKEIEAYTRDVVEQFDIRGTEGEVTAGSLSGGNQQKLILGRELTRNPDLILAAQPTRGVDVGAIEYIHKKLLSMRDEGRAILLISAELEELKTLSDRMIVLYEGEIVARGDAEEFSEEDLGLLMAGKGGKR